MDKLTLSNGQSILARPKDKADHQLDQYEASRDAAMLQETVMPLNVRPHASMGIVGLIERSIYR